MFQHEITLPGDQVFEIKPCGTGEITDILDIERECFGPDAWTEDFIRQVLSLTLVPGIFKKDKLIAYGVLSIRKNILSIDNLAVRKGYRRIGLASAMLELMLGTGKRNRCKRAVLQVEKDNQGAIALYEKFGFTKVRILKGYYSRHGQPAGDAWEMEGTTD